MKFQTIFTVLLVNIIYVTSEVKDTTTLNAEVKGELNTDSKPTTNEVSMNDNRHYKPRKNRHDRYDHHSHRYDDDDDDDDDNYDRPSYDHGYRPRPPPPYIRPRCPRESETCDRGNSGAICYNGFNCPPCWVYNRNGGKWDCYDYNYESGKPCIFDWIDVRRECRIYY